MAISRTRKEELVAQYTDLLSQSKAIFVTEYSGLNVQKMEALRGSVREADGTLFVTKNTLLRIALEQAGKPVPDELLQGQVAAGFSLGEAPTLAKALKEFAKKEEALEIKGAVFGDEILSAQQVADLAELPTLDELRAQIIGVISAPARDVASVLASGVRQVVNVLDAYAKSEDEAEAAA